MNEEMLSILEKGYPKHVNDGLPQDRSTSTNYDVILNAEEEQRLQKIIDGSKLISGERWLRKRIKEGNSLHIVYTVAPKGHFHLGFVIPLFKLKKLKSLVDSSLTIILADVDAFLDNEKCPWNIRDPRCDYYILLFQQVLALLDLKDVRIIRGSDYQLKSDYTLEMYQMASVVTRDEAAVLEGITVSSLLSPIYFTIDQYHLNADLVIMGEDMRLFANFAEQMAQRRGQQPRAQLLISVLPSMSGNKMSASDPEFHLSPLDTPKQIKQKIARSFCEPGNLKGNIAFELAKHFVFPYLGCDLVIERTVENGGNVTVKNIDELQRIVLDSSLHPADLKAAVVSKINHFYDPIRAHFAAHSKLISAAFPSKKSSKK